MASRETQRRQDLRRKLERRVSAEGYKMGDIFPELGNGAAGGRRRKMPARFRDQQNLDGDWSLAEVGAGDPRRARDRRADLQGDPDVPGPRVAVEVATISTSPPPLTAAMPVSLPFLARSRPRLYGVWRAVRGHVHSVPARQTDLATRTNSYCAQRQRTLGGDRPVLVASLPQCTAGNEEGTSRPVPIGNREVFPPQPLVPVYQKGQSLSPPLRLAGFAARVCLL